MIEKNYIIVAHTNPCQLKRLINRLDDGYSNFYIHIDKKTDINNFVDIETIQCVSIIKDRVDCIWGDFSSIQASLNCISEIINDNKKGYTIFLSGQCYPLGSNFEINTYLKENIEYNHIDIAPVEDCWDKEDCYNRLSCYKINLSSKKYDFIILPYFFSNKGSIVTIKKILKELIKKINVKSYNIKDFKFYMQFFKILHKRQPVFEKHYGGSNWSAFNYNTLVEIYNFIDSNKEIIDFYRYTFNPDELFYQTIMMKLCETNKSIKIKKSLTYVNFPVNSRHPVTFNKDDYNELKNQINSNKLFARKFDTNHCESILDLLDDGINNQEGLK